MSGRGDGNWSSGRFFHRVSRLGSHPEPLNLAEPIPKRCQGRPCGRRRAAPPLPGAPDPREPGKAGSDGRQRWQAAMAGSDGSSCVWSCRGVVSALGAHDPSLLVSAPAVVPCQLCSFLKIPLSLVISRLLLGELARGFPAKDCGRARLQPP